MFLFSSFSPFFCYYNDFKNRLWNKRFYNLSFTLQSIYWYKLDRQSEWGEEKANGIYRVFQQFLVYIVDRALLFGMWNPEIWIKVTRKVKMNSLSEIRVTHSLPQVYVCIRFIELGIHHLDYNILSIPALSQPFKSARILFKSFIDLFI